MRKQDYKITIITAAFNSGKTIEQTISSVVNQEYNNIEYIIIDGASNDNTVEIIKKYEKYGVKWISEPDDGLYDALNKGIEMATGDFFQILGSDDSLYSKNTIANVVSYIEEDVDVLSSAIMVVDEVSKKEHPVYNYQAINKEKYKGGMIPHPGMFVKMEIGKSIKFDTAYNIAADYKFFLQCYYNDSVNFKFIDEPVVFFSNGGVSSVGEDGSIEINRIYKELGLKFNDMPKWKKNLGMVLKKMRLLSMIKNLNKRLRCNLLWNTHHCSNKICRWCGRK